MRQRLIEHLLSFHHDTDFQRQGLLLLGWIRHNAGELDAIRCIRIQFTSAEFGSMPTPGEHLFLHNPRHYAKRGANGVVLS